jgi:hypothetical protein
LDRLHQKQSIDGHNRVVASAQIESFIHRSKLYQHRHGDCVLKASAALAWTDDDDGCRFWWRFLRRNSQRPLAYRRGGSNRDTVCKARTRRRITIVIEHGEFARLGVQPLRRV